MDKVVLVGVTIADKSQGNSRVVEDTTFVEREIVECSNKC
jgi:hypothetical protein